ncbi:hypothetical protein ACHAAC_02760 [Aeromicrobium sp. CF4.19]|uniref:hypothetical protein n=1 Tax=Aeromicrobium sp. CF4.19 TaxID=3373082 RepID=UPI003EE5E4F9
MSRIPASLFSTALLGLVVLAALTEVSVLVAAPVLLVQGLLAAAPSPPDAQGRAHGGPRFWPALLAGLVATVLVTWPGLLAGPEGMRAGREALVSNGVISGIIPAVAVAVLAALVAQMLRRDGRPHLVASTGHAATLGVFAALAACWISATRASLGAEVVIVAAVGIAAALLVWALPLDRFVSAGLALVAGGLAAAGAGAVLDGLTTWLFGLVLGMTASIFAILGQVLGRAWSAGRIHASQGWGFPGALAVTLPAPVVHVCGQLLGLPGL